MRRGLALLVFLALFAWGAGFLAFVAHIENLREPAADAALPVTDAIVVLTGGSERVETGLRLLEAGRAKKLFISGVHKGLSLDNVLGAQPVPANLRACCIVLGHQAGSTFGNADETQIWMTLADYHSLRLVTANYHMPRSLMIFRAAMPGIEIMPHPVMPSGVRLPDWWRHPGTLELLATEYVKYLVAWVRVRMTP